MLNIGKLAAGGEGYYLAAVASGVEDYYTGSGEAAGHWIGAAAGGLGLCGEVAAEDLRTVLGGLDPGSKQPLGSFKSGRSVPGFDCAFRAPKSVALLWALADEDISLQVREAHDAAVAAALAYLEERAGWARRGAGGHESVQATGFVAAAFRHRTSRAGDPLLHTHVLVANLIQAVDDGAWRTLDARRLYAHAKTAGCLYQAALRDELTRRLGVEWNAVHNGTADLAGVPRPLIEAFSQRRAEILAHMAARGESSAKAAQVATLATRRAKGYGVEADGLHDRWRQRAAALGWREQHFAQLLGAMRPQSLDDRAVANITADLAGPMGLTAKASTFTRRDTIQGWCARLRHGGSVTQICRLADKLLAADAGVAVELLPIVATAAVDPADVAAVIGASAAPAGPQVAEDVLTSATYRRCVAEILAVSGWTATQVRQALLDRELHSAEDPVAVLTWRAQRLIGALDPEALSRVSGRLAAQAVIRREDGRLVLADPDEMRYSTPELLALEQRVVTSTVERRGAGVALADDEHVDAALRRRPSISEEQATMARRITTSGAGVDVVVGRAGSGKTFALDAARDAWQAAGVQVLGTALAARAATELAASTGIDCRTLDSLLLDLERPERQGGGLRQSSVVIVDEAGMVGTRKLARLLDHAHYAHAKVVLVGDHHQLPEIDAGGVFRGLVNRLPAIELTENRRQRQTWEHAALDELRSGSPAVGLAAYDDAGRVHVSETAEDAREQLVRDWWAAHDDADGPASERGVMIAVRVADVEDLNSRARVRLVAAGALHGPALEAGGRELRAGDRVVCLRNDRRLGVVNGTRAWVTNVDAKTTTLQVATHHGRELTLPGDYLAAGHLAHAYAITGHKAQGLTCERTFILGTDELYREWAYTALSRHRDRTDLYVVGRRESEPDAHPHTMQPGATEPLVSLAKHLERSRAQQLAADHLGTVDGNVSAPVLPLAAEQRRDPLTERRTAAAARSARHLADERDRAVTELAVARQRHEVAELRLANAERGFGRLRNRSEVSAARRQVADTAYTFERWRNRITWIEQHAAEHAIDLDRAVIEQQAEPIEPLALDAHIATRAERCLETGVELALGPS